MLTQQELMARFAQASRDKFNPVLFERNEDDIIKELLNVIKSCERHNQFFTIKLDSYRVVDDYDEINSILFNYYENLTKNKAKSKKRDNQYGYINLNESRIRLLIVKYYIADRNTSDFVDVIIAVPRIIDKYYFNINGIMRSTLFQIVDGSTYNNGTSNAKIPSITLKIIFMATRVTRYYNTLKTTKGEDLRLNYYHSRIFNKGISAAKYILAKLGYYGFMEFMGIQNSIFITDYDISDTNPEYYTFKIDDNIYINSPKFLLDSNPVIQSVVVTFYNSLIPGLPYQIIFDDKFWVRSLGAEFSSGPRDKILNIIDPDDDSVPDTLEKGYSILDSFESIYDISTKESIRLPESEKATTYHVIRWIMREFNALRMKDNLDISIKKIRFAEYIASLYAFKIAQGIYRVSDANKKATVESIRKAIRTDPNFLLVAITKSKMISYRNMVSDMDSMQALKFTYKGVSGLGENSNQSIPNIYRSIHPSHIGRVDLDASSDGNPGITGTICPFTPIYNGFFDDYQEPNSWEQEFMVTMDAYKKARNLKDALVFEENVLGKNKSEDILVARDTISHMQEIISPVIYADEGEIINVSLEDLI